MVRYESDKSLDFCFIEMQIKRHFMWGFLQDSFLDEFLEFVNSLLVEMLRIVENIVSDLKN